MPWWRWRPTSPPLSALKGTSLRGHPDPKRRFSLIVADSCVFLEIFKTLWKCRFCGKPQILAGSSRKPQEPTENRRLAFVPNRFVRLSAALPPLCFPKRGIAAGSWWWQGLIGGSCSGHAHAPKPKTSEEENPPKQSYPK